MPASIADYLGRTVDLAAFQVIAGRRVQLLAQELVRPGEGGTLIAGIQKLAQWVLVVLLTRQGSHPTRPLYGTAFLTDARAGRWRTVADVEQSFYSARTDVRRQLQEVETDADPTDERYGGLELSNVVLAADKVSLTLTLTSLAGTEYTYLTPLTVPLR